MGKRSRRGHRDYYEHYEQVPQLPAPADGVRLRAPRRPVGVGELSRSFERALTSRFEDKVLSRGSSLAREGRIHRLNVAADGTLSARAVGTERYGCSLRLSTFTENTCEAIVSFLSDSDFGVQALGALRGGDLPWELESHISHRTRDSGGLVPVRLESACTCPYGARCKHVAALCLILVEALDSDPLLALELHGFSRERLPASAQVDGEPDGGESVSPAQFWDWRPGAKVLIPLSDPDQVLARLTAPPDGIPAAEASCAKEMLAIVLQAAARLS